MGDMSGSGKFGGRPLLRLPPWSEARRDGDVWVGRGEQVGVGDGVSWVWSSRVGSDLVGSSLVGEILHRVGEVDEENCGEAVIRWLADPWLEELARW